MPAAERLVEQPAGRLREPVVDRREDREQQPADQHVVEVRDHEVRVGELPVERRHREHDPGETGTQELEEEPQAEQHRRREPDLPAPEGGEPVEDLDAGRHRHQHGRDGEEGVAGRRHADGEHVVRPHPQADEGDGHRGGDHEGVAEDHLAGENRQHV